MTNSPPLRLDVLISQARETQDRQLASDWSDVHIRMLNGEITDETVRLWVGYNTRAERRLAAYAEPAGAA